MELKDRLAETVEQNLDVLDTMEIGTDEFATATSAIGKLTDKVLEFEKIETDKQLEEAKLMQEKKSRRVNTAVTIITFAVTSAMTIIGSHTAWKKEEKGYVPTDIASKFHINNLLKGKK